MSRELIALGVWLVVYAAVHSLLATDRCKAIVARRWPALHRRYRILYSVFSTITLIPILAAMSGSPLLYTVSGAARTLLTCLQVIGVIGFLASLRAIDVGTFVGLERAKAARPGLTTTGPYGLCRHPLYLFGSVALAARPDVSHAYAVFTVWTILYFWIGSWFEEARMSAEFGAEYDGYRRRVPHFLPRLWPQKNRPPRSGEAGQTSD